MPMHRLTSPVDGWPLAVHEPWPPPARPTHPPVLAIHALALCGRALAPALAPLAATRRVLLLDVRGHGQSVRADDGDGDTAAAPAWAAASTALWRALAADVVCVVDALALHPYDVVAHSLGAGAAILAARTRPWRRAWLFEPPRWPLVAGADGRDLAADNARFAAAAATVDLSFDSVDDAAAVLEAAPPFKWFDARVRAAFCAPGGGVRPTAAGGLILAAHPAVVAAVAAALMEDAGAPRDADYEAAAGPTAVGVGPPRGGVTAFLRRGALAGAAAARARVVEVGVQPKEAGHYGPLVDPDGVGRAVEAWLAGVEAKL